MAKTELTLKLAIDPEAINDIKRALHKDIAEAVESAYREGWNDASTPEGLTLIDDDWNESDTKKKLDEFLKL